MTMFVPLWKWRRSKLFKKLKKFYKDWGFWPLLVLVPFVIGYLIYLYEVTSWHAMEQVTHTHLTFWQFHALKNVVIGGRCK
jgi:hypothetical protein